MADEKDQTTADMFWARIRNHRLVATTIVIASIVIGLGQLTGAIDSILDFAGRRLVKGCAEESRDTRLPPEQRHKDAVQQWSNHDASHGSGPEIRPENRQLPTDDGLGEVRRDTLSEGGGQEIVSPALEDRNEVVDTLAAVAAEQVLPDRHSVEPCVGEGAVSAIRAYALSVAYPESLPGYIARNASLFAVDGPAIRCLEFLMAGLYDGRFPIHGGESNDYQEVLESRQTGPMGRLDPTAASEPIAWLSLSSRTRELVSILPSVAQGDSSILGSSPFYRGLIGAMTMAEDMASSDPVFAQTLDAQREVLYELSVSTLEELIAYLKDDQR